MSELRIPTRMVSVVVTTADGRSLAGQVFVPADSARHPGPMRPDEWINEPYSFFPFLAEGSAGVPILLNKSQVAILSLTSASDEDRSEEVGLRRKVVVECGARRIEGMLRIEMPTHHSRVLDQLNRPEPFLVLREGDRDHLIFKRHVTRVIEVREE
jgi:hypothetical protein